MSIAIILPLEVLDGSLDVGHQIKAASLETQVLAAPGMETSAASAASVTPENANNESVANTNCG